MTIKGLVNAGSNVHLMINAEDLRIYSESLIKDTISRLSPKKEKEVYLDVKQTCDILQVDRSTLWRWDKTGYLKPYRIGGKVRYRLSEIDKILGGED